MMPAVHKTPITKLVLLWVIASLMLASCGVQSGPTPETSVPENPSPTAAPSATLTPVLDTPTPAPTATEVLVSPTPAPTIPVPTEQIRILILGSDIREDNSFRTDVIMLLTVNPQEGPSDDEEINQLRSKMKRNFIATLLLSQGVPMLLSGDEIGRTQNGNNNVYCQDNELSWLDWSRVDSGLLEFTRRVIALRNEHPVFRQRRWFEDRPVRGGEARDIGWFTPDGVEMTEEEWGQGFSKALMVYLNGGAIRSPDPRGNPILDTSFLLMFNAHYEPLTFTMPPEEWGQRWQVILDTARDEIPQGGQPCGAGCTLTLDSRSLVLLQHVD